jgi:hypothetical protein
VGSVFLSLALVEHIVDENSKEAVVGIDQDGYEVAIELPEKPQSAKCCPLFLQALLGLAGWFLLSNWTRSRNGSPIVSWGSKKKVI